MKEIILRNILSKEEAERIAKRNKGIVEFDDLNSGKYMVVRVIASNFKNE